VQDRASISLRGFGLPIRNSANIGMCGPYTLDPKAINMADAAAISDSYTNLENIND